MTGDAEQEIRKLRDKGTSKVKVAVTDIDGILRGKYIHWDKFESAASKGLGFCSVIFGWDSSDVCYDNSSYTGWHTGYPDAFAKLDLRTLRQVPWDNNVPFVLGDFYTDDGTKPLSVCPRQVLKRVVKMAADMGYEAQVGCEFEWFNFRETPSSFQDKGFVQPEPLTPGMFGYSLLRSSMQGEFFNQIMDHMNRFRVPIEGLHTETGPGVYEAAIQVTDALEAADRAVLFKAGAKEIAGKHNIIASFMAKWNESLPGCSGHVHQSLKGADGKNLFHSESDSLGMSELFKSYLAGQLKYIPSLLPMLAPTVNSFKRLVKGYWAPVSATWGVDNRTVAFRVIPGGKKATRLEVRVGGADINPYLAVAASLGAGLLGIKEGLRLQQSPIKGNGYDDIKAEAFPSDLRFAADKFKKDEVSHQLFGEDFVNHFANSRLWEWQQYQKSVTSWELKRYFEII